MTKNPLFILENLLVAGELDSDKSELITYTWIDKNCTMVACRLENYSAKVPGSGTGCFRQPTLTYFIAGSSAQIFNYVMIMPSRRV